MKIELHKIKISESIADFGSFLLNRHPRQIEFSLDADKAHVFTDKICVLF